MSKHIENREKVFDALKRELVGPDPQGSVNETRHFPDIKSAYEPCKQSNGEEILQQDRPLARYGVGILYPVELSIKNEENLEPDEEESPFKEDMVPDPLSTDARRSLEDLMKKPLGDSQDTSEFSLRETNQFKQNSMGISFVVCVPEAAKLVVDVHGGRYGKTKITREDSAYSADWWLRRPVHLQVIFSSEDLLQKTNTLIHPRIIDSENIEGLRLCVEAYSRPMKDMPSDHRLVTVVLINRTPSEQTDKNSICLFQSEFQVSFVKNSETLKSILPYQERILREKDEEEQGLALLYRYHKSFGIGHGCAVEWDSKNDASEPKDVLRATQLPRVETPSITSEVNGVSVSMRLLAGLEQGKDGFSQLQSVIDAYEDWIKQQKDEQVGLGPEHQAAANRHLSLCTKACERMQKGLDYLRRPDQKDAALKAFRLANHAILLQQICGRELREISFDEVARRITFEPQYQVPDTSALPDGRGNWRAFQIAFLLMSIVSVSEDEDESRDLVELIWFPTGGGKTEAYLGLSAYTMFLRRIKNLDDVGVHVLMRYTLRLLTAQQFQRASGLICAMEYIRHLEPNIRILGKTPFSIGIWVGGSTTPNNIEDARKKRREMKTKNAENPFLISRCPWCGAPMGQVELTKKHEVLGYSDGTKLQCPDKKCLFADTLPIYVIDEIIYKKRPSLIIGTVDKFAQLAWQPQSNAIFGLNTEGERVLPPPSLILQDELHLISGPLGSMVGFFEVLIEELCIDRRKDTTIRPKIVCATATIRRYKEQVKALYNREDVALFPPPGLKAEDSFFSRYARDEEGHYQHGKMYVGVHAPSYGSMLTTQVRVNATLLQAAMDLSTSDPKEADPWWTLLVFFNSIRELGGALTLFGDDIPERLKQIRTRRGLDSKELRYLNRPIKELTSRLRSDEVPRAIDDLMKPHEGTESSKRAIDVCLASNIIEVGVDIERLGLMSIVGQPKTTSQYIQVSGRVGRRTNEPGLVVTIYNPSKPRDRSHYEKFQHYHESLYAQVEPTSVTPFSPPLIVRTLHALLVAYVRQNKPDSKPDPVPEQMIDDFWMTILEPRIQAIDPTEIETVREVLDQRKKEWLRWGHSDWKKSRYTLHDYLLYAAGEYISEEKRRNAWATPTSLRNVDSECEIEITSKYQEEE